MILHRFLASATVTACLISPAASAQHKLRLLVVNQGDKTLSVVDPAAMKTVATIDEHQTTMHGHEIAVAPDGRTAFLPVYGDVGVGKPGLNGNEMLVIDVPTGKITRRVDFGHGVRPHCPIYDKATGKLYVTTEIDKSVSVLDPKSLRIEGHVPTGAQQSHMLAITPDGRRGYTANVEPGSVSVLDLAAGKTVKVIPISAKTQRIALSNDGRWVFTSDQTQPRLAVIDTQTNEIAHWVDLPGSGYGTATTHDGNWLLVPIPQKNVVAAVNLHTMKVEHTIPVPNDPQEMIVSPDGKLAYVSCMTERKVAVIDLGQWKMAGTIDVGDRPDGLAWAHE